MKRQKAILPLALALCLILSLSGCSSLKDHWIAGWNQLLQSLSKHALTGEKSLQGDKTAGQDSYTGSYTAEYAQFSGTEYLFGGTALERKGGNDLTVTYELQITSGAAKLCWSEKGEIHTIAAANGSGIYTVTLSAGDQYIVLQGEQFTGSLQVTVA